ncbi:MAG: hypothetical protein IPM54_39470 [Polyangiaceae bacterium]|nr:hypothetical protein [Polyangiaceae bacterium]
MRRRSIARDLGCVGFVFAMAVGCSNNEEQPVNTATGTAAGPIAWAQIFKGQLEQSGSLVATTKTGQIVVAGIMQGSVDFGDGGIIDSVSESDLFLAWINRDGKVARVRRFGETGGHFPMGLAIDAADNVIVTGIAVGSIDFGGGMIDSQDADAFVAAFGADGEYQFAMKAGGAGDQISGQAVIADDGSIVWSGMFQGDIDIGGTVLTSKGETDIFVAKLSPMGSVTWARGLGGDKADGNPSIAVTPQGQVLVGGYYQGTPDLGAGALPDTGMVDGLMLVALDSAGQTSWSRGTPQEFGYFAYSMHVDEAGSAWLAGPCAGEVNLFGTKLATPAQGIAIAKLNATGQPISTQIFEADAPGYMHATRARGGGIVIAGEFESTIKLAGQTLTSAGQSDLFFIWIDSDGRVTRQERTGGTGKEIFGSVSMLPTGHVVVTGAFEGAMNAGGAAYSSIDPDGFVMMLN